MAGREPEFETLAVRTGLRAGLEARPTTPSIHTSTTFVYDDVRQVHDALRPMGQGYAYSRNANPTVRALEETVAALEETEDGVAFASGMAALHAAFIALGARPGATILAAADLYGVTRSLLSGFFGRLQVRCAFVDAVNLEAVEAALEEQAPCMLVFEPISNPLLRVPDVAALIEMAHDHRALVVVDNTFPSPFLLQPAILGADVVVHSATKYISGHGDVTAGIILCDGDFAREIRDLRTATGGILGPFEAWLVLRGVRTLALRVRKHCDNALALAAWLEQRPEVSRVYYPGLESDPAHDRAATQFRDGLGGGLVSFELPLGLEEVEGFMNHLRLAVPGTSLGDVETLVLCPALSSHRTLTAEERRDAGIADGLVRVSVGLESISDI
ncbi:MAG TPA: aminotransferase class I/II-fold pyridoxal phosphate-dependent enzyme, partial [Chloroflexota bacterium]|nr:aminotransferase class I/II-fold pyridoxal phosphate-dependent enzyme [Chloroflexota bacterium]